MDSGIKKSFCTHTDYTNFQKGRVWYGRKKVSCMSYRDSDSDDCGMYLCVDEISEIRQYAKGGHASKALHGQYKENEGMRESCMGQREIVYLKIEQNVLVKDRHVTLQDIASLESSDAALLRQLKQKKIHTFADGIGDKKPKKQQVVFSILKIVELIHEEYPAVLVVNEGESDFVLEYDPKLPKNRWWEYPLVALLCVVTFFGAAFTIMAFNNDIGITDVFEKLYVQTLGSAPDGVGELEICYCIGLAIGITVFFNHVGRKKITPDPTPLQVQMRKYEQDVDTTFIENAGRGGHSIDVK